MNTTNYFNTFIAVSEDCPICHAEEPPKKERISIARALFELAQAAPYTITSDVLIIQAHAMAKKILKKMLINLLMNFIQKVSHVYVAAL